MAVSHDRVLRFMERLDACESRAQTGGIHLDLDQLSNIVAEDPEAAERFVETQCRQAPDHPAYLCQSFRVAEAADDRLGNRALKQRIFDTLNEIDGWDEFFEAISPMPSATKVGAEARRVSDIWWRSNPEAELLCSECREAIPHGNGYITRRAQKRGKIIFKLGEEHLCESCFRRWLGRSYFRE